MSEGRKEPVNKLQDETKGGERTHVMHIRVGISVMFVPLLLPLACSVRK